MYAVGINGKWTADGKATPEFFKGKGCTVQEARLFGDFDVFFQGIKISTIFTSQSDQIAHLTSKGLI